jgi:5-deoxy-glucuronate isomerase
VMPERVIKSNPADATVSVTPETAGWGHVGFSVLRLDAGEQREWTDDQRELCLVILSGSVAAELGEQRIERLGTRASVFDGPPSALYAPAGERCSVRALDGQAEIALCWAPGTVGSGMTPRAIGDVPTEIRGEGIAQRTVHPILMDDAPAESLLVVEVLTPAGHWSSFPPHKHDVDDPPRETLLEETYYHRLHPTKGFALQRVYSDDGELDDTVAVHDGDVVLVERGYHVVAAMPGYDLYYLNVMAGPRREWLYQDDPAYAWLRR